MKLAPRQAGEFLRGPAARHVGALIYGPDSGMVQERCQAVINQLLPDRGDPFAFAELSDETLKSDPSRLYDECAAISLMGGRRLVFLRGGADRHSKAVESALPLLGAACYLLISAEELASRSTLRTLFEQAPNLAALPCYPDEAADIASLVRARLEEAGTPPTREAVEYLTAQLGNDRGVTLQELNKLALFAYGKGQVTLEDAMRLVEGNTDAGLSDAAVAAADRDPKRTDAKLAQLFREGESPVALLRVAQKHFHMLYQLAAAKEQGVAPDQAVAALRPPVFFKLQPVIKRQAAAWTRGRAAWALHILEDAERACKSTGADMERISAEALLQLAAGTPR